MLPRDLMTASPAACRTPAASWPWLRGVFAAMVMLGAAVAVAVAVAAPPTGAAGWTIGLAVDESGVLYGWGQQVAPGASAPRRIHLPVAVKQAIAGARQGFAIGVDGTLWGWGNNVTGQLGDGTFVPRALPVQLGSGYVALSSNVNHTLAIQSDGTLWTWGSRQYSPARVGTDSGYSAVAAGYLHSVAVKSDGSVWTWGRNEQGQLGLGSPSGDSVALPMAIGLTHVRAVAAGYNHSLALKTDGTLWAWGDNTGGQLGDGTGSDAATPRLVGSGYVAMAAQGYQSMGVKSDGSVVTWGSGTLAPTLKASGASMVAAGFSHGLALQPGGQLIAWGNNRFGQLGDGSTTDRAAPVRLESTWAAVSAGESFNLALKADGSLWAWGDDFEGQLGNGPPESKTTATVIGTGFRTVAAAQTHRLALKSDGSLWSWGQGSARLGLGVVGNKLLPEQVGSGYMAAVAGSGHSMALKTDGILWTWGGGSEGQLGYESLVEWLPRQLGVQRYSAIAAGHQHSLAMQADGTLWAWGANSAGQLGLGDRNARSQPTRVGGGYQAVMAGGNFSLAFKSDGSLWVWGSNEAGQLGLGHLDDRLTPTLLGNGYTKVAAGYAHVAALRADGSLWVWGNNDAHELGRGDRKDQATPIRLGEDFVDVFSGAAALHTMALRRDGTVWIWGLNSTGQLGDGTLAATARPLNLVNEAATGSLRLAKFGSGVATAELLAYLLKLQNQGYDLQASITDLRASGLLGEVYFTALLPRNSPLAGCVSPCSAAAAKSQPSPSPPLRRGPLSAFRPVRPLADAASASMVAGVLSRGGFKQTSGSGSAQADSTYNGDLGRATALSVASGVGDALTGSNAVICMGVTVPELSAKGQVLMRPIATGSAVEGVVQCPPVQTAATLARFRSLASGPISARTIVAEVTPLDEERGQVRQVFSWAVTADGRQFMQTAPNVWEPMAEPMQPVATVTLPSTGNFRLEVTRELNLVGLEGTLVFIGVGANWPDVRDFNKAGQHYTVQ